MKLGIIYKVSIKELFLYGSTINFSRRKNQYLHKLRGNIYENVYLQRAFNKYGEVFIKFEIVQENIPEEMLENIEDIWIGANCSRIEDSLGGMNMRDASRVRHSEETKNKISISRIGKSIGKDNPFYGKKHTKEAKEKMSEDKIGKKYPHLYIKVAKYDLKGNFIEKYSSLTDASLKNNIDIRLISKAINSKNTNYTKGFLWDRFKNTPNNKISSRRKKRIYTGKIILQYDKLGNLIREFSSGKDAAISLGLSYSSEITRAAKDSWRTAYGFKWKYKN